MTYIRGMSGRNASILLAAALVALGAVGIALVLQHGFGMEPCAWCTFQRLLYLVFAALAALARLSARQRIVTSVFAGLALATALAGLWAALHQQFVAAKSLSCSFTFADRALMNLRLDETLPWLFAATASCGEANVPLLGIPFAWWSATLFGLLALAAARAVWRVCVAGEKA